MSKSINMKYRFKHIGELTGEPPLRECVEISIPVPWGIIAGKWYGPQHVRPILAGHGWLDNAGSFDYLAKLLPSNLAFLAIDLPGHGLSTHLPNGCVYHIVDFLLYIRMIMEHYKWKKVSLVAHSMFASVCFQFAAMFPNHVDFILAIDVLIPQTPTNSFVLDNMSYRTAAFLREVERIANSNNNEPPSYTLDELIERLYEGGLRSVEKDRCPTLLARDIQVSKKHDNRYFFARDGRVKYYNYVIGSIDLVMDMAKRITCPHMYIKAANWHYQGNAEEIRKVLKILEKKSNFYSVTCNGTHHLHLNTPENMIEPFLSFIQQYGP